MPWWAVRIKGLDPVSFPWTRNEAHNLTEFYSDLSPLLMLGKKNMRNPQSWGVENGDSLVVERIPKNPKVVIDGFFFKPYRVFLEYVPGD